MIVPSCSPPLTTNRKQNIQPELHHEFLKFPEGNLSQIDIQMAVEKAGLNYNDLSIAAQSNAVEQEFHNNIEAAFLLGLQEIPAFLINRTIFVPRNKMPNSKEFLQIIENATK